MNLLEESLANLPAKSLNWEFESFLKKLCDKVLNQNRAVIKKAGCGILKKIWRLDSQKAQASLISLLNGNINVVKLITGVLNGINDLWQFYGDEVDFIKMFNGLEKCLNLSNAGIRATVYKILGGGLAL